MNKSQYKESCARLGVPFFEHEYHERQAEYIKSIQADKPLGVKFDNQKPQWSLVPSAAMEEIVDVLTYGANKYSPDNWKYVDNHDTRYFNAAMRHLWAWRQGEKDDSESHKSHLAHAACCLLFLMAFDQEADKDDSPF